MAARETKKQHTEEKAVRKLTTAELAAMDKCIARLQEPSGRFRLSKDGSNWRIGFDHPDQLVGRALVMDAFATADRDFVNGIVDQLAKASGRGEDISEHGINFMLSVIKGIEPMLETMLAAQMAAVHVASMSFARQFARVETIPQQDSAERAFNKLTRTFTMQMEALKRHRTAAEQKVTLRHVSVADGGQAIVGNVTQVPREKGQEKATQEKAAAPPRPHTDTNVVPMRTVNKSKEHDSLSVRRKSNK